MLRQLIAALGCVMPLAAVAAADTIHVYSGDSIQVVINSASAGDEIVVHPGTYVERITPAGKAITLRSSDGPEMTIIDGGGTGTVISCTAGEGPDTVVEGLTIANGDAPVGGGMYNSGSSPTLTDCIFTGNSAESGGGMCNYDSNPTLANCTFVGNTAERGGGMCSLSNSSPTLTNCTFSGNLADQGGGGVSSTGGSPTLTNCTFSGNLANWGGGMYNTASDATLDNCTFIGNSAYARGGGMCNSRVRGGPTLTNCTFAGNSALVESGGIYNWDVHGCTLTNCILWSNTAPTEPQIADPNSATSATYSCIAGGWSGAGNIDADPRFIDPDGPDGDPNTWADNDYHLAADSPCIDAGDPNYVADPDERDMDGESRVWDGDDDGVARVDIGADEFVSQVPDDPNGQGADDSDQDGDGSDQDGDGTDDGDPAGDGSEDSDGQGADGSDPDGNGTDDGDPAGDDSVDESPCADGDWTITDACCGTGTCTMAVLSIASLVGLRRRRRLRRQQALASQAHGEPHGQ